MQNALKNKGVNKFGDNLDPDDTFLHCDDSRFYTTTRAIDCFPNINDPTLTIQQVAPALPIMQIDPDHMNRKTGKNNFLSSEGGRAKICQRLKIYAYQTSAAIDFIPSNIVLCPEVWKLDRFLRNLRGDISWYMSDISGQLLHEMMHWANKHVIGDQHFITRNGIDIAGYGFFACYLLANHARNNEERRRALGNADSYAAFIRLVNSPEAYIDVQSFEQHLFNIETGGGNP